MKAIAEVATAKIRILVGTDPIQLWEALLCSHRSEVEERVLVIDALQDFGWIDLLRSIDRNEVVCGVRDSLESVHPVVRAGLNAANAATF